MELIVIRHAVDQDAVVVSDILKEAARWLEKSGTPLWQERELEPSSIVRDVNEALFFIAEHLGDAAGVVRSQLEDTLVWPDVPQREAAYIHRLALRRRRSIETANRYLLVVEWQKVEDHTVGFRQFDRYLKWRDLLHHFYDPFPIVEHYEAPIDLLQ